MRTLKRLVVAFRRPAQSSKTQNLRTMKLCRFVTIMAERAGLSEFSSMAAGRAYQNETPHKLGSSAACTLESCCNIELGAARAPI